MIEYHNAEEQINFLRNLKTSENEEMIEGIINDLRHPYSLACITEAEYMLMELGVKYTAVDICDIAEEIFDNDSIFSGEDIMPIVNKYVRRNRLEFLSEERK